MKVTLVYDGNLAPTANQANGPSKKKWEVREQVDPQLRKLWDERPDLSHLREYPAFPKDGHGTWIQAHPLYPEADRSIRREIGPGEINLCEEIIRGTRRYLPLVRKSLALTCGLRVLFLRREPKGHLWNNDTGDLDNRIKTLVDGLAIPQDGWSPENSIIPDPVYCLLEDDKLVTSLEVRTEQLLSPQGNAGNEVRLMIEVDVRIAQARPFNMLFASD